VGPREQNAGSHRTLLRILAIGVLAVAVLDVTGLFPGPGNGPLGLAQVLAAHITIGAFLLAPFAFLRGAILLRAALAVLVVAGLLRFGGEWWSMPGEPPEGPTIEVVTFNLEVQGRAAPDAVTFLRPMTADVIALQELTTAFADAIATDPRLAEIYPYQAFYPRDDVLGLGILSRHPLSDVAFEGEPSRLRALVTLPDGPVQVLNVHPLPARMPKGPFSMPIGFDPANRDAALGRISDDLDDLLGSDASVILLGDINTAPTEPEFGRFTAGLVDAHAEVGIGPGWTYRPDRLEPLGIGMIRIDVVLAGSGLRPVAETTRCPPAGDHCAVLATLVLQDTSGQD
jgi:vancomycin resistance protein VanJ